MSNSPLTRRQIARRALAGAAGALLVSALGPEARAQVVDPAPAAPPPLPLPAPVAASEDRLLIALVPLVAGYAPSEAQAREAALALKDYPGPFAAARAYALPDEIGPAFAADAPARKERVR